MSACIWCEPNIQENSHGICPTCAAKELGIPFLSRDEIVEALQHQGMFYPKYEQELIDEAVADFERMQDARILRAIKQRVEARNAA